MNLYWIKRKNGLDLCVEDDNGTVFNIGGVRETKRGIEAMAKANGYDPGRATRGLNSIDEAQAFVEQFEPWRDFFPGEVLELEANIREPKSSST